MPMRSGMRRSGRRWSPRSRRAHGAEVLDRPSAGAVFQNQIGEALCAATPGPCSIRRRLIAAARYEPLQVVLEIIEPVLSYNLVGDRFRPIEIAAPGPHHRPNFIPWLRQKSASGLPPRGNRFRSQIQGPA